MKNHLKRLTAPKTWLINRRGNTFITRPNPGAHSLAMGLPLGIVIRDYLQLARTMDGVKQILNRNEVLVDGQRRTDHRTIVGLFDILSIPSLKKFYKVEFDPAGRLIMNEITEDKSRSKVCKVVGKKLLKKGIMQLGLHDGKTITTEKHLNVGDSLIIEVPTLKINKVLSLKPNAKVLLIMGKHRGTIGNLEEITASTVICQVANKQRIETAKKYLLVIE